MKAYILKISFENITPLIWRRFILPANATFNRLHETIQNVTNFQSRLEPYHSFSVQIDDYFITNNQSILEDNQGGRYAGKQVKQPARIKIGTYLEKHGSLIYNYDFGDDWNIHIVLEETVDDYYFGYPTLLDGEETAPPEDVGGPHGYEAFFKVYQDPKDPDYLSTYTWAEGQNYLPLDIDAINERLKYVKYAKTEWENIDHENYHIRLDKYRGTSDVDLETLSNKDLIMEYAIAFTNLYGLIPYNKFLEIYNAQNELKLLSRELKALLADHAYAKQLEEKHIVVENDVLFHDVITIDDLSILLEATTGKPFYIPEKEILLRYKNELYYEKTSQQMEFGKMLADDFFGGSTLLIHDEIEELVFQLRVVDSNFQSVIKDFLGRFEFNDIEQMNLYAHGITMIANHTRLWENRGHTPHEILEMEKKNILPLSSKPLTVIDEVKAGRNDPCPCGSGKKFKRCCGK